MTDLFETPELIPDEIQTILQKYALDDCTYLNCLELQRELEHAGYTIDWGLDAEPFNLRPILHTFIAHCRETSQSYSFVFIVKDTERLKAVFDEFELLVPFRKWYYEIQRNDNMIFIDIDDLERELTFP